MWKFNEAAFHVILGQMDLRGFVKPFSAGAENKRGNLLLKAYFNFSLIGKRFYL